MNDFKLPVEVPIETTEKLPFIVTDVSKYKQVIKLKNLIKVRIKPIFKFYQKNYDVHDERFVKLTRHERRKIYGDIDQKLLKTLPNVVSPYVSLTIPVNFIFVQN